MGFPCVARLINFSNHVKQKTLLLAPKGRATPSGLEQLVVAWGLGA